MSKQYLHVRPIGSTEVVGRLYFQCVPKERGSNGMDLGPYFSPVLVWN